MLDFAYDGGGRGQAALATLSVNGRKVGEERIEHTAPNIFSADEGRMWGSTRGHLSPRITRIAAAGSLGE
jgi:hypothetical protein